MIAGELPTLLTENEAYEKFGQYLEDKELRRARRDGSICYFVFKGKNHYREADLKQYIIGKLKKCQRGVKSADEKQQEMSPQNGSKSPTNGLEKSKEANGTTAFGMTPELQKSAAVRLAQRTSKKQSSG